MFDSVAFTKEIWSLPVNFSRLFCKMTLFCALNNHCCLNTNHKSTPLASQSQLQFFFLGKFAMLKPYKKPLVQTIVSKKNFDKYFSMKKIYFCRRYKPFTIDITELIYLSEEPLPSFTDQYKLFRDSYQPKIRGAAIVHSCIFSK